MTDATGNVSQLLCYDDAMLLSHIDLICEA